MRSTSLVVQLVLLIALLVECYEAQLQATLPSDDGTANILNLKYGLFVHSVPGLTVNYDGVVVNDANEFANTFDANQFANDLVAAGVQYVVYTAWHSKMVALWPSEKMLQWDLPNHRVDRDLIGEMIAAVRDKNIRIYLYTHPRDGMQFTAADQEKTGWGIDPPPEGQAYNPGADFNRTKWNSFINDIYGELMQRYGQLIDGLFIDEGSPQGDSEKVVDYPQLRSTIKAINPHANLIHNDYGNLYGLDMGMKEYGGWGEFAQPNESLWPSYTKPVAAIFTETWWAANVTNTVRYSARSMLRYTAFQAGSNSQGGGIAWAAGPYADGGWEPGVMPTLKQIGSWIYGIRESIFGTRPSTSYLTNPGTTIAAVSWGSATKSPDDSVEYIHVLKPPTGLTLALPAPRDGKVFGTASLLPDSLPVVLSQDTKGVKLTIPGSWDANLSVIKLTVLNRSGFVPLYRCANGRHHMDTTDPGCEASIYSLDGLLGYIHAIQLPGTVPLYRCYSASSGDHMDTTDSSCESSRYAMEGTIGYIYQAHVQGSVPLYRCYSASTEDHMDTTDASCESPLYSREGILGYVVV
ncbi:glycoside hydrolase superfamily [Aspergillus floccosus]